EIPLLEPGGFAFAVCDRFSQQQRADWVLRFSSSPWTARRGRNWLPARSRVLEPWSDHGSGTHRARLRVSRSEIATSDFADSSAKHSLASCDGENWNDAGKRNYVSRLSNDCVRVVSGAMAGRAWRWMNSRASAR